MVSRRKIVNTVAKFIEESFGYNPSPNIGLNLAKLTIEIFPGLQATVGDATVSYRKVFFNLNQNLNQIKNLYFLLIKSSIISEKFRICFILCN